MIHARVGDLVDTYLPKTRRPSPIPAARIGQPDYPEVSSNSFDLIAPPALGHGILDSCNLSTRVREVTRES
jgi:hypothetical protein